MLKEFKEFALKGNMIDMAVGIIIGSAFGGVVNSLVKDIIMPPVGLLMGNVDFSDLNMRLSSTVSINYGVFVNTIVNFFILAFAIFIVIRQINKLKKKPEPSTKKCPQCLSSVPIKAIRCAYCTSSIQ